MERLTRRDKDGKAWFKPLDPDCGSCDFAKEKCIKCYGNRAERLAAYEDAEEQGRMVVLPCKVGDTVWFINRAFDSEICQAVVAKVEINLYTPQCPVWFLIEYVSKRIGKQEFHSRMDLMVGKTVFLTREEAEAALERSKHE